MEPNLHVTTRDSLDRLRDRLYCTVSALLYGDDAVYNHYKRIGGELYEIFVHLESIIEEENKKHRTIAVEMEKFEKGFAYGREQHTSSSGAESEVHGMECKTNGRKSKKDSRLSK